MIQLYNKLFSYGKRRFFNEQDAEDFRGWAIIKLIEGRRASFSQLYTDYVRQLLCFKVLEQQLWSQDNNKNCGENARLINVRLRELAGKISEKDLVLFLLVDYYGFSKKEIADFFNKTKGCITYRYKKVMKKLNEAR